MALLELILWGVPTLIILLIIYATHDFQKRANYFKKHGIPYLGSGLYRTFKLFTGSSNIVRMEMDLYAEATKAKSPMVGFSDLLGTRSIYVTDLDLVKNIYVKHFDHFVNRRPVETLKTNLYFKRMLFAMESDQWKGIRTKLSPSFTTGKIRRMFQIFKTSSERMGKYINQQIKPNSKSVDIEFGQIFPKYAMDVIASCAFGIDSKSWEVPPDQRSTFEQMGKQFQFQLTGKIVMKILLLMISPKLLDLFGLDVLDYESTTYFANVVKDVMKRRRESGERREDFLQLMMDTQQGLLKADEETNQVMLGTNEGNSGDDTSKLSVDGQDKVKFGDDDIIANGMLFLMGGFDPAQTVLIFTVYNLALYPDVQEKLFEEVKNLIEKNGGKLTYDAVVEMKYLDLVINETMRLFPPSSRTERLCTKDYIVPGTKYLIEKGSMISIPIHPFHHDAKYFPDPEKFIPERFTPENKAARHPYAFMPFGHGPRNCIGMRFALIKVKTALAQLISTYQLEPCSKTNITMEFGSSAFNLKPKDGMWLKVTPRS